MEENNEKLILNPEFIPFYPSMFRGWFLAVDCILFWFIKFFLANNDQFFCTDKQIWDMLWLSVKTISRSFKKLREVWLIKTETRTKKWGWTYRTVELVIPNGHGWPFANGHGWPSIKNKYNNLFININKLSVGEEEKKTQTSKKVQFTPEQNEQFEALRKEYPIKSKKELARKHFLEHDYNELMFDAKIRKRKVELEVVEKQYMRGWGYWMEDFAPQWDRMKKLELKQIFERHMTMWGDMRTRMEELVKDFPDVNFNEFLEEINRKKTEYALWDLIPKK